MPVYEDEFLLFYAVIIVLLLFFQNTAAITKKNCFLRQFKHGGSRKRWARRPGEKWRAMLHFSPPLFKAQLRCRKTTFQHLVRIVRPKLLSSRLTAAERVGMFLWFSGRSVTFHDVANTFQRSSWTCWRHIYDVMIALVHIAKEEIQFPAAHEPYPEWTTISSHLSNCVGAIDGTLIPLLNVPLSKQTNYYNRKKNLSINVLAIVSPTLKFLQVLSGWEGSANDAFLWKKLKEKNTEDFVAPSFLIGDSGFPLERNMLVPYRGVVYHERGNRTPPANSKEAFNRVHARARACVERAFGVLKMRFPSLMKGSSLNYKYVGDFVISCITLHNLIMRLNNQDTVEEFKDKDEQENESTITQKIEEGNEQVVVSAAELWRDSIARDVFLP